MTTTQHSTDATTGAPSTATPTDAASPVWANPWVAVRYEPVTRFDGVQYDTTVVRSGTGIGAVIVPCCSFRGVSYVGVIDIARPAVGNKRSLEFPRGGTDDHSAAEALRELSEETSLVEITPQLLGLIYPDNGMLDTEIGVWRAQVIPQRTPCGDWTRQGEHWLDPETGSDFRWVTEGEFLGAISSGRVSCGITLATWAMHQASPARR